MSSAKRLAHRSPEWLNSSVIYQIFLRAFTPEGTLKSAQKKLEWLENLGIDIVYLCPICLQDDDMRQEYWSKRQIASGLNNPKNPYRIKDYFKIDPEYGTEEDLHDFVEEAHKRKIKILLDMVYLHCGPSAIFLKDNPDFVKRDENGRLITGEWNFPHLNFDSRELRRYLIRNMEFWVKEFSIDGFRCDAAEHTPLDFWEEARKSFEKYKPDTILFSEGGRPEDQDYAFDLNYSYLYYNAGNAILNKESAIKIREAWDNVNQKFASGARFARFLDNHDIAHDKSETGRIEAEWGFKAVNAAFAMIFAMDGVPYIYNGQEIADRTKHNIYAKMPIDWTKAETREAQERFKLSQELIKLRHTEKALTEGSLQWIENNKPDKIISFIRHHQGKEILILISFDNKQNQVIVDSQGNAIHFILNSGITNEGFSCGNSLIFNLEPFSYCFAILTR